MRRRAHPKMVKRINIGTLLKHIRAQGPVSRSELVKITNLSPTTVSVLVEELIEQGLVKEVGTGQSSGGRRPILLDFQSSARLALGIDIGVQKVSVALLDLDGNTHLAGHYKPDLSSKEIFLAEILAQVREILHASQPVKHNILGIGVATPGLLDKKKESIIYSSSLGFTNVALHASLAEHFSLPIRIDNDMNAAALGEKVMGAGQKISELVYISVESGVGAGLIINNRIYGGATGSAGEFGHITVEPAGPTCKCGNKGCLGIMVGEPAILSRAVQMLASGAKTKITSHLGSGSYGITQEAVFHAAKEGDPVALAIVNESMDYLAVGIANLINMFNPAVIILGGSTMETLHPLALNRVRETVSRRVLPFHGNQTYEIIPSQLKERVKLVGASTLIFSEFLDYAGIMALEN